MIRLHRFRLLILLAVVYGLAVVLLSIGFFTPQWAVNWWFYDRNFHYHYNYNFYRNCSTVGLISGECRFDYNLNLELSTGNEVSYLVPALWMMTAAMSVLYVHLTMVLLAISWHNNQVYMSFFSVVTGVLYPIAAILVLTAASLVTARFRYNTGFSTYVTLVGGVCMLFFYAGIRAYDYMYSKMQRSRRTTTNKSGT